jgi:hypothetical protein
MHPHRSILRGDSSLVSEVAECAFLQVHDPQSKPIFGLEGLKKRGHTPADLIGELQRGTLVFRKFPHPGVHRTRRGISPAIMIDQGVAENPIEPGHNLFALHAGATLQATYKCGLQDIFSDRSGLDAPFQERQKLAVRFH